MVQVGFNLLMLLGFAIYILIADVSLRHSITNLALKVQSTDRVESIGADLQYAQASNSEHDVSDSTPIDENNQSMLSSERVFRSPDTGTWRGTVGTIHTKCVGVGEVHARFFLFAAYVAVKKFNL